MAQFAAFMGVTSQRVYQWVQQGMPHRKRASATRIIPREAIAWLRERDRASARNAESPNEAFERARRLRIQANREELAYQQDLKQLIPAEEFRAFIDGFVGGLAAVAAGRLQRFEREIVRATTAAEARRVTQAIHVALMEGAQEYAQQVDDEADALEQTASQGEAPEAA